jgi:ATP-dependent Lhr-like helicase
LLKAAVEKKIDKIHIPTNCLDVLAQSLDGFAIMRVWDENELYELIKQSYCYRDISHVDYNEVVSYLAGEYTTLEDRHVYAKIWRKEGKIGKKGKLGRILYMTNLGTIPEESFIIVKVGTQTIGHIDEGFLEKLRPGDVFILGGDTYQFKYSSGMVAQVTATSNRPPTVPSWFSDMLPLSVDLANEIGRFRYLMEDKLKHEKSKEEIRSWIHEYLYVDKNSAEALYNYFAEQYSFIEYIPSDKKILIEHYNDEKQHKIIFHTLYGRRVNDVLSRAVAFAIARTEHKDVEIGMNDNGFYIGFTKKVNAVKAMKMLKADKLDLVMKHAIDQTEVLKRRFRHCATRGFMILRRYMGHEKRIGRQQVSSMILLSAVKRISEDFPVLKEARREVLEDLMDIENTKKILEQIESGKIKLVEVQTKIPSPFAFNIALQGYMDVLKMEDKVEFLKRMNQMVLAKIGMKK